MGDSPLLSNDLLPREEDLITLPVVFPADGKAAPLRRVLDAADPQAANLLVNYLLGEVRNPHTRAAYKRAIASFLLWLDHEQIGLQKAQPYDLRAYSDQLARQHKPATVNQHLTAITGFYQYLRERSSLVANPAQGLRRPRNDKSQRTPYLPAPETQQLLESIPTGEVMGLRDRALIGCMVYTFTRVSAALDMTVKDYFLQSGNHHLRIIGKRGVHRLIPVHPTLNTYLSAYLDAAGIREQKDAPLFQSAPYGKLSGKPFLRGNALRMVKARCDQAGIEALVCCHTFRAVGITAYLESDGAIERAAHYAGHASTRTTQIYDRRKDIGSPEDIARIKL